MRRTPIITVLVAALVCVLAACTGTGAGPVGASSSAVPSVVPLPSHARAYFVGDSWTRGYGVADGQSFPWVLSKMLGWTPTVDGQDGTGYVYSYNPDGRLFPERARSVPAEVTADVVVLMGGINDQPKGDLTREEPAALATITALQRRFPAASIVVVGPAQSSFPVPEGLRRIDTAVRAASATAGVRYVSPLRQRWFSKDDIATYIDAGTMHPSQEGQEYIADRIRGALVTAGLVRWQILARRVGF